MEFDEFGPCACATRGIKKICKNCENCTVEYKTGNAYCLDVSPLRIWLLGPRRVKPTDTCKNVVVRKNNTWSR